MQNTVRQDTITHEAAHAAVAAAVAEGLKIGIKVNAAVVDAGGNLLAFLRTLGAFLVSITIAQDKAYTSVALGMPTLDVYGVIKSSPALREGLVHRERLIIFGGGLPIVIDGMVVGGLGVSGGSEEQDIQCARAGLAAIGVK